MSPASHTSPSAGRRITCPWRRGLIWFSSAAQENVSTTVSASGNVIGATFCCASIRASTRLGVGGLGRRCGRRRTRSSLPWRQELFEFRQVVRRLVAHLVLANVRGRLAAFRRHQLDELQPLLEEGFPRAV